MNKFFKNNFFLVSLGAVPAAILRWQIDDTYIVNIVGCFLLGLINSSAIGKRYKFALGFGFCGSLTTFSGLSFQLFKLINQGLYKLFIFNCLFFVIISLITFSFGNLIARKIFN